MSQLDNIFTETAVQPFDIRKIKSINEAELWIMEHGGEYQQFGEEIELCKLTHRFVPGMYIREILMPAGSLISTKTHLTENPFIISQGHCIVFDDLIGSAVEYRAPYTGITKIGTRRLLYIFEDTIWTTFHVTNLTDVEAIEHVISKHTFNPLIGSVISKSLQLGEGTI